VTPSPTPTATPTNTPTPTLKPAGGGGCAMATTPRPDAAGNSLALFAALALVGLWSVRRLGQGR
jgi:MYXO-CTERM domain-containing protein